MGQYEERELRHDLLDARETARLQVEANQVLAQKLVEQERELERLQDKYEELINACIANLEACPSEADHESRQGSCDGDQRHDRLQCQLHQPLLRARGSAASSVRSMSAMGRKRYGPWAAGSTTPNSVPRYQHVASAAVPAVIRRSVRTLGGAVPASRRLVTTARAPIAVPAIAVNTSVGSIHCAPPSGT